MKQRVEQLKLKDYSLDAINNFIVNLVPPKDEDNLGVDVSSRTFKTSLSLSAGAVTELNSEASIVVSYKSGADANQLASILGITNPLVIYISFKVKDGVDAFSLGELSATFKTILSLGSKGKLVYTLKSKLNDDFDGSKIYTLLITFTHPDLSNSLDNLIKYYNPKQIDARLDLNQNPGSKSKEFLEANLKLKIELGRDILQLLEWFLSTSDKDTKRLSLFRSTKELNLNLEFDNLKEFYLNCIASCCEEGHEHFDQNLKILNWEALKHFVKNPLSEIMINEKLPAPVIEMYKKLDYLSGLHGIGIVINTSSILEVKCKNFNIFGVLPSLEELKEVKVKVEEEIKAKKLKEPPVIKVAVFGEGETGKSALIVRYVGGNFVETYVPTIEDAYRKSVVVDEDGGERTIDVNILDTAGTEQFSAMRDLYFLSHNGFIIVYSVGKKTTFEELKGYWETLARVKDTDNIPIVLIGNKIDLEDRAVSYEDGKKLADSWNAGFWEVSVKNEINVKEAWKDIVERTRAHTKK